MPIPTDLNPSPRLLLGPGPSAVHPRVLRAMTTPLIGYLDPEWLALMDEEQVMLREVFVTENALTLPMSGTGSAGMETAICNFLEPDDRILVGCNGYFSERICEMAARYGAVVTRIEKPWGEVFTLDEIEAALRSGGPFKVVALVHAETSTGALQPLEGVSALAHQHGALLMIDCVTSLGGTLLKIDEWGVDVAYSGSQKCLGCPPGLSPFTAGERAMDIAHNRKTKISNWYLDLTLIEKYWSNERVYHHTPSTTLHYGFREGLRLTLEEGLENRWRRHRANAEYLWEKLEGLDLSLHVRPDHRLPPLTTVQIPNGVDDVKARARLRDEFNIEIAGGFGQLKGKVWRIGLMGFSSRKENVALLAEALREVLAK
jgi:alanine-glyoxylate transaminase/serine-glyoxylate transaminase/serine-pyruvate transaminase